ncbi:MAG: pyruvate kinase [Nanoarchaeota archaeon]|nr:pyruvate kinase [Nanoarchaeota archaeon]
MKTKIIVTLGPSSDSPEMIRALGHSGADIFRNNFSHCRPEEYEERLRAVQAASKEVGRPLFMMVDLQGPRIRVGVLPEEGRELASGEEVVFSTRKEKENGVIFIDNPYLHLDIQPGDPMFLLNGEIELQVMNVRDDEIITKVLRGGMLFSRKGVNVPRTKLTTSGLTEKDRADLKFALGAGVDYVAVSFVQAAEDVSRAREIVGDKVKIISKIETALALKHIDSIIQASDAIMIARGDLGIEVPVEEIPFIQKNLIRHATWHRKPAIVATQMLTSMIRAPHPTRAEVSDIANAVWDGAQGVMLSDETASGGYPLEALRALKKIVHKAEEFHFNPSHAL